MTLSKTYDQLYSTVCDISPTAPGETIQRKTIKIKKNKHKKFRKISGFFTSLRELRMIYFNFVCVKNSNCVPSLPS